MGVGKGVNVNAVMYGVVTGDYPGSETWQGEFDPDNRVRPTLYIVPFEVTDVRKDASFRPAGICFVTVVFRAALPVSELGLSPETSLSWGGDASFDAGLTDMLPFTTGPHHGFREVGSERLVGHGAFFRTIAEARLYAKRGSRTNIVSLV